MWNTVKVKTLDNIVSHGLVKIQIFNGESWKWGPLSDLTLSLSLPPLSTHLPTAAILSLSPCYPQPPSIDRSQARSLSK